MDNAWELYSDHEYFKAADLALDEAWAAAKCVAPDKPSAERAKLAERQMFAAMERWADVGAMDTEPRAHLAWLVKNHFGVSGGWA
jgi:hypothetical protein